MRMLTAAMSVALILAMGLNASAQDADDTKAKDDQGSAERQTIRGTVAGVTVVGETMIDHEPHRAAVAQASYLTILGSPRRDEARHEGQGGDPQKPQEVRRDSSAEGKDEESGHGSQGDAGPAQRRRSNVYLVAITPRTKVFESSGDDSSGAKGSASREDQGQSQASFERVELGDRVEVEFRSEHATTRRTNDRRHGRHRTFRGMATSITILPGEDSDDHQGPGSSSTQGDETSNQHEKT